MSLIVKFSVPVFQEFCLGTVPLNTETAPSRWLYNQTYLLKTGKASGSQKLPFIDFLQNGIFFGRNFWWTFFNKVVSFCLKVLL